MKGPDSDDNNDEEVVSNDAYSERQIIHPEYYRDWSTE